MLLVIYAADLQIYDISSHRYNLYSFNITSLFSLTQLLFADLEYYFKGLFLAL